MKRGVITVYLSIVFLLLLSLVMVLLESVRVYIVGTMTERYADMAAEMVFASYVQPLAKRYDILAVDAGKNGENLDQFQLYLNMNLKGGSEKGRNFGMDGQVQEFRVEKMISVRDNSWKSLKDQIENYEKYALGESGVESLQDLISQLKGTGVSHEIEAYSEDLYTGGQAMDTADVEKERDTSQNMTDPRAGISRWIKSGLLDIVMGDQAVSARAVDISECSWQTGENKKQSILDSFSTYKEVTDVLNQQSVTERIARGLQDQKSQLWLNLYILDKFDDLCKRSEDWEKNGESVLKYEIEYILSGHETDRENLESAVTGIFTLRALLNLTYLYTSPEKGVSLQNIAAGINTLSAIPVVGQVLELLLMVCWASAEAIIDCAALTSGKRVPLMKNDSSWNLTMEQLITIAEKGGRASAYIRDGSKGLDYGQYLLILLLFISQEKKFIRMAQLMECNIRLTEGYEQFRFSECAAAADFSGEVQISEKFWRHPEQIVHRFYVKYGY